MTMLFRTVCDAIKSTLNTAAAGRYLTIGYQRQTKAAEEIANLKTVQVFYNSGEFPESGGSRSGPVHHNATYTIWLSVSVGAVADVAVLEAPGSTEAQISAALLAAQESSEVADKQMDELIEIVWKILMDARNQDFEPANSALRYQVSNRWISNIRKGQPQEEGSYFLLTAEMNLSLTIREDVVGEATTTGLEGIDTVIEQDGDPNINTGVNVTTTPP